MVVGARETESRLIGVGLMVEVWVSVDKGLCLSGVGPYTCLPWLSCTCIDYPICDVRMGIARRTNGGG